MHEAPKKPEPLPRKDTTIILWVTAFLVFLVLIGWGISIKQVLKDGIVGAQEGVDMLVESGEEIKETAGSGGGDIVGSVQEITSMLSESAESIQETQAVVEEIVAAMPETIDSYQEEQAQEAEAQEAQTLTDVLELTQEKLQAE